VLVILLEKYSEEQQITADCFATDASIKNIFGYHEHRALTLAANSSEEVSFERLRPHSKYEVIVVVDLTSLISKEEKSAKASNKNKVVSVDTSKIEKWWNLTIETMDEQFDIEWSRLDQQMRLTELRAAILSELVQAKSYFTHPTIALPTDEELCSTEFLNVLDPKLDSKALTFAKLKLSVQSLRFYDWWIGDERSNISNIRSDFQSLECIHAILDQTDIVNRFETEGFATKDDCQLLVEYVRMFVQLQKQGTTDQLPGNENSLLSGSIANVSKTGLLSSEIAIDSFQGSSKSTMPIAVLSEKGLVIMKKFRSWYKGGQIVLDAQEFR
jgi:hypothetical protein